MQTIPVLNQKLFIVILFLATISSCRQDQELPMRTIFSFTLKYDINNNFDVSETWIVIRDHETGDLIDSKQILINEPVIFESNKPISSNKLAITLLRAYGNGAVNNTHSFVYNGIDVGSNWVFAEKNADVDPLQAIGSFTFTIEDVPTLTRFAISNRYGEYGYDIAYQDNTITGSFSILEDGPQHLVVIDNGDKPKYQWITNLAGGENVVLNYSDFKEFDSYITVDFPETTDNSNAFIEAFENEIEPLFGYTIYPQVGLDGSIPQRNDLTLGFLDELNNYTISVGDARWSYRSNGAKPTSIEYLEGNEFEISGETIEGYSLTATRNYNYSFCNYSGGNHIAIVYDPSANVKHHSPYTDELIARFSISMEDFVRFSSLISLDGDDTYEHQIRSLFDPTYSSIVTKRVWLTKD